MQEQRKEDHHDVADFGKLERDVQTRAPRIMSHMNKDHGDSVKAYARAFGVFDDPQNQRQVASAKITDVHVGGFVLEVILKDGRVISDVQVPYPQRLSNAKDLHKVSIQMHIQAFDKLGAAYKLTNGYYTAAAKMIGAKMYKTHPKLSIGMISIAAGVVIFAGSVALRSKLSSNDSSSARRRNVT